MNSTTHPVASPAQLLSVMLRYPRRWLIPAVVVAAAGGAYALLRPATWEASQALVIRNDAANNQESLGKFVQLDEMRTVQETILELLKSRSVLTAALVEVGPPAHRAQPDAAWPTEQEVVDLREAIKLTPPKGAEFGKTEVFYLRVHDHERSRAVGLASALSGQLEAGFQKLRDAKAASVVGELQQAIELSARDLGDANGRLAAMERQVGSDLAELRNLHEAGSGESLLRRLVTDIRAELRQARTTLKSNQELLALLKAAEARPDRLVAMPNTLLDSQPALRRLKDGLVDAQLSSSQLLGRMSAEHPMVKAAKAAEQQIVRHVHDELANSVRAVEVDLRLVSDRAALLDEQLASATGRLERLAALRTPYANLVAETRKRTELWDKGQQRLADARASQATARAASLISRLDRPDPGTRPMGPSRAVIVLVGLVGGLATGFGVVLLTVSPSEFAGPASATSPASIARPLSANSNTPGHVADTEREIVLQEVVERLAAASTSWN
jgi:polysaccharide biosynthesis transport protein